MQKPSPPTERRRSPRLKAHLEAELLATLSLLDSTYTQYSDRALVFMGETHDLSEEGLALILPSIRIDENHCKEGLQLSLGIHLPSMPVQLEIQAVRCHALREDDPGQGYFMGARITGLGGMSSADWLNYLNTLRAQTPKAAD